MKCISWAGENLKPISYRVEDKTYFLLLLASEDTAPGIKIWSQFPTCHPSTKLPSLQGAIQYF